MNILITGASGFVGSNLVRHLLRVSGVSLTVAVRHSVEIPGVKVIEIRSIESVTDWSMELDGIDVVVHLAACAHNKTDGHYTNGTSQYEAVNVDATLNLASHAARAGVRRFIYMSSIGVNGRESGAPFREEDSPNPSDDYARSKLMAEHGLWELKKNLSIDVVIVRPVLVYGPNAPGNFGRLVKLIHSGLPLPFASIDNKRSFIAIDNLVDLIGICIYHPAAANQVFLAADGSDISIVEMIKGIAVESGRPSRLFGISPKTFEFFLSILGKRKLALQFTRPLRVDISKARRLLHWEPKLSTAEGLKRCFENRLQDSKND